MAFFERGHIFLVLFLVFIRRLHTMSQDINGDNIRKLKSDLSQQAATETFTSFIWMFEKCYKSRMSHKQFLIDDLQKFVNYPSKTTVGLAPKYTSNRKFFANMITTTAFKEMLAKDREEIWNSLRDKIKYCDEVVMDQSLLKEFYNREVDQSKLKC